MKKLGLIPKARRIESTNGKLRLLKLSKLAQGLRPPQCKKYQAGPPINTSREH